MGRCYPVDQTTHSTRFNTGPQPNIRTQLYTFIPLNNYFMFLDFWNHAAKITLDAASN